MPSLAAPLYIGTSSLSRKVEQDEAPTDWTQRATMCLHDHCLRPCPEATKEIAKQRSRSPKGAGSQAYRALIPTKASFQILEREYSESAFLF